MILLVSQVVSRGASQQSASKSSLAPFRIGLALPFLLGI